jgi:hypothetical protein
VASSQYELWWKRLSDGTIFQGIESNSVNDEQDVMRIDLLRAQSTDNVEEGGGTRARTYFLINSPQKRRSVKERKATYWMYMCEIVLNQYRDLRFMR